MKTYNKYKWLMFFTRKFKSNDLVPPKDLKDTFSKFTDGGPHMSGNQFRRFLVEHQGHVDITESESEEIVDKILKARKDHDHHGLTLDDVFHFLLLDDFNSPLKSEVIYLLYE